MPLENLQQTHGAVFKDAVLSRAETRGMELIAEAGKKRAAALEKAYQQVTRDATKGLEKRLRAEHDKELAGLSGRAQRDLLLYRAELVNGLFARVEKQLAEFVAADSYVKWFAAKLHAHADALEVCDAPVLYVRPADSGRKELFTGAGGLRVEADNHIRLGGFLLACGNIRFDDTFDTALDDERRAFYESGVLSLDALGAGGAPESDDAETTKQK